MRFSIRRATLGALSTRAARLAAGGARARRPHLRIAIEPGAGSDEVLARAERLLGGNGVAEVTALLGYCSSSRWP